MEKWPNLQYKRITEKFRAQKYVYYTNIYSCFLVACCELAYIMWEDKFQTLIVWSKHWTNGVDKLFFFYISPNETPRCFEISNWLLKERSILTVLSRMKPLIFSMFAMWYRTTFVGHEFQFQHLNQKTCNRNKSPNPSNISSSTKIPGKTVFLRKCNGKWLRLLNSLRELWTTHSVFTQSS